MAAWAVARGVGRKKKFSGALAPQPQPRLLVALAQSPSSVVSRSKSAAATKSERPRRETEPPVTRRPVSRPCLSAALPHLRGCELRPAPLPAGLLAAAGVPRRIGDPAGRGRSQRLRRSARLAACGLGASTAPRVARSGRLALLVLAPGLLAPWLHTTKVRDSLSS